MSDAVPEPVSLRSIPYSGDVYRGYREVPVVRPRRGPGLHILLFAATFATTAMASAFYQGHDIIAEPASLLYGFPYAIALMSILLAHECGHYFLARAHRVDATLPYFIPAPPIPFFIGTVGAFIRMRSMPRDRRALFDVGAAGPWAGMMVAIPALILGLQLSDVREATALPAGTWIFGDPLLLRIIARLVLGVWPDEVSIELHPIAFAGWVGCLVTALNLLPAGQLDGGHVVYAAFGERWHRWISRGTVTALLVLGLGGAGTWLVWAALLAVLGVRHPTLQDTETPLDRPRLWAAVATMVLFILTFIPQPLYFTEPAPRLPRDEHAVPVGEPAPLPGGGWRIPL